MHNAVLYEKTASAAIKCNLCNHKCFINPGQKGVCGARLNVDGQLYTLAYGNLCAANIDPIEKKPLYHFLPGTHTFSIAIAGCNFRCAFCQNAEISQVDASIDAGGKEYPPHAILEAAQRSGCDSISYTYTEPTIFFEYTVDTARLAKDKGIRNVYVTNGYMTTPAIDIMAGLIDAANVDLKSFNESFYKEFCGASLKPVLESIEYMKKKGIWVEVTTLVIDGCNDSAGELRSIAAFIASLDPKTPWHISRAFGHYKMPHIRPTPIKTLEMAQEIGRAAGLEYVYVGNTGDSSLTVCPKCSCVLIKRAGYAIIENKLKDGCCPECNEKIAGVWE